MRGRAGGRGKLTVFVRAHRVSTVQSAHTILVLVDGAVVERGMHSELRKEERCHYSRIALLQNSADVSRSPGEGAAEIEALAAPNAARAAAM